LEETPNPEMITTQPPLNISFSPFLIENQTSTIRSIPTTPLELTE